jgi:hypothetical protein
MKAIVAVVALLAVLASAGSSEAVLLTHTNTTQLAGVVVTVNIGSVLSGVGSCPTTTFVGCTTLSVQLTTNPPITNTPVGIDQFLFNATTDVNANAASPGTWMLHFDGTNADGFGDFNSNRNQDSVGTSGISSPIVFTLFTPSSTATGITTFTPNLSGANFAAHVTFRGGCEGWVSDGTASASPNSSCTPVPEPITIFLGGTGLLGMAWAGRKRLFGRFASNGT